MTGSLIEEMDKLADILNEHVKLKAEVERLRAEMATLLANFCGRECEPPRRHSIVCEAARAALEKKP